MSNTSGPVQYITLKGTTVVYVNDNAIAIAWLDEAGHQRTYILPRAVVAGNRALVPGSIDVRVSRLYYYRRRSSLPEDHDTLILEGVWVNRTTEKAVLLEWISDDAFTHTAWVPRSVCKGGHALRADDENIEIERSFFERNRDRLTMELKEPEA